MFACNDFAELIAVIHNKHLGNELVLSSHPSLQPSFQEQLTVLKRAKNNNENSNQGNLHYCHKKVMNLF